MIDVRGDRRARTSMLFIVGTRPETIKLAPLIRACRTQPDFAVRVCVSAQHRQMMDQALTTFGITPDYDLDIMKASQTPTDVAAAVLLGVGSVLDRERPDWVFVQGDTTTTMAAALAAFHSRVSVAHVEAGLRTGNFESPWPEEMNRVVTSRLARLHFAPTETARNNLLAEGVASADIHVTGNTGVDALLFMKARMEDDRSLAMELAARFPQLDARKRLILVTVHRREKFGRDMDAVCHAVRDIAGSHDDVEIVFPVHLNPQVRGPVGRILQGRPRVHLVDPVDYAEAVYLMARSTLILTDSGGIQEEAPSLGVPVLVLRDDTERIESVNAGLARLVGVDQQRIVSVARQELSKARPEGDTRALWNPYGDGLASSRIVEIMRNRADDRGQ